MQESEGQEYGSPDHSNEKSRAREKNRVGTAQHTDDFAANEQAAAH
jgi:hypothetical protein